MKTLLENLWSCKNQVLIAWLFFFCVSLTGESPYSVYKLFLISGAFSMGITMIAILYVKSGWYRKQNNKMAGQIMKPQHEVIVYDENGDELERTMESINVTHMTRFKHVIGDYTTYSFNTHYDNGLIHYGMVPSPPFSGGYLKDEKLKR
jgi:NAD(P)H-nitrite reductase large subunit